MSRTMLCPRCWRLIRRCYLCNGSFRIPDEQLTPNFSLSELLRSETALRLKLLNDPTPQHLKSLRALAVELLQPVRDLVGPPRVNSGFRLPDVNSAIGGSKTSAHCHELAADVVPLGVGVSLREVVEMVAASDLKFDQVIYEGTWVHLGLRNAKRLQRRQVLMYFGGKYLAYDRGDRRIAA